MGVRRYSDDDLPALADIVAKPEISRWWGRYDRGRLKDFIDGSTLVWTIVVDGAPAGVIGVLEEPDPEERHVDLDVFLDPAHHDRGIGTDSLRQVLRMLFEGRGHHRATLSTMPDNDRAIHVYEKLGFRRVGILRRSSRQPDGEWQDELLMDLLAEEMT